MTQTATFYTVTVSPNEYVQQCMLPRPFQDQFTVKLYAISCIISFRGCSDNQNITQIEPYSFTYLVLLLSLQMLATLGCCMAQHKKGPIQEDMCGIQIRQIQSQSIVEFREYYTRRCINCIADLNDTKHRVDKVGPVRLSFQWPFVIGLVVSCGMLTPPTRTRQNCLVWSASAVRTSHQRASRPGCAGYSEHSL